MAVASSLPLNQRAMILVTVIPATSAPTPKTEYPAAATNTPVLYPKTSSSLPAKTVMP